MNSSTIVPSTVKYWREQAQRRSQRWVVKLGSSLLTQSNGCPDRSRIRDVMFQLAALQEQGVAIVLVASGAVSVGRTQLDPAATGRGVREAAASLGQAALLSTFHEYGAAADHPCGQVLLDETSFASREKRGNICATLDRLVAAGGIPLLNGNDAICGSPSSEVHNNDLLAARVARLWKADFLLLLTDQVGVCTADPRQYPEAGVVPWSRAGDARLSKMVGSGKGKHGTGGMATKLQAAERVAAGGIPSCIADGRERGILLRLRLGEPLGTLLVPDNRLPKQTERAVPWRIHPFAPASAAWA